jgi:two-component system, sensor histidine kinase PdtaS
VTELVINALKHAFPNDRRGTNTVAHQTQGTVWTLSVGDDGVGIPKGAVPAAAGLGTGVVLALAKPLKANVIVADNEPGTAVSVIRTAAEGGVEHASTPLAVAAV